MLFRHNKRDVTCHNNPQCHSHVPGHSQPTAVTCHETTPPKWLTSVKPQSSKLGHLRVLIPHISWCAGAAQPRTCVGQIKVIPPCSHLRHSPNLWRRCDESHVPCSPHKPLRILQNSLCPYQDCPETQFHTLLRIQKIQWAYHRDQSAQPAQQQSWQVSSGHFLG